MTARDAVEPGPAPEEPATPDQTTDADGAAATSPMLDHLDETIRGARRAAEEALAPQRDQ